MRSQMKVLLVTLALGAVVAWGPRAAVAISGMETFQIAEVEVRGLRVLTRDSVVARMQLGAFASVWGDRELWAERLASHPLVRRVEVSRKLPNGLHVVIEERQPVALAATPILEPVDAEGYRLPIDPTLYRMDLPIIATDRMPPEGSILFPEEIRAMAAEVDHLTAANGEFMHRVSTVEWMSEGVLVVHLVSPDVDFIMPSRIPGDRLREGEAALSHAMSQNPGRVPEVVDLRFSDQVVIRGGQQRRNLHASYPSTAGGR